MYFEYDKESKEYSVIGNNGISIATVSKGVFDVVINITSVISGSTFTKFAEVIEQIRYEIMCDSYK